MLSPCGRCPQLQIIAIHDYNVDPSYIGSKVDSVKPKALASGQRLLYEEFGATGSSKQSQIQAATDVLIKARTNELSIDTRMLSFFTDRRTMAVLGGELSIDYKGSWLGMLKSRLQVTKPGKGSSDYEVGSQRSMSSACCIDFPLRSGRMNRRGQL